MSVPPRLRLLAPIIVLAFSFVHLASAASPTNTVWRRSNVPSQGFFNPADKNGSMLTFGFSTSPPGLGEPFNMIISGNSDPAVLVDQDTNGGLRNFFLSIKFSSECLGQHLGSHQVADLGDGHGGQNETAVIRYDYNDPSFGTCKESIQGGSHFRYWVQNGPSANSGAVFMAVSYELNSTLGHDLIYNGYNLARDWIVGNITGSAVPTAELTNTTTYSGTTQFGGFTYKTSIDYVSGLLQNSSNGINHFLSVGGGPNNSTAIDGLVAVMTVNIKDRPSNSTSAATRARIDAVPLWTLATVTVMISTLILFRSGL